ncbi:spermidine/putrescine ABC transporter substrate-binding protein [Pelagibius litoralis]|uniref:Spermidine/putrescine ABC transporter substrate-binding protein n=1 Tax=Pelagibius litoralis TaxID=374515 RepID=A0A967CCI3_9PROT|nr:spermidine/putrescine ABC transporter substrate-binding protein [Pelagibius litoralis]NIA69059.1 spermidine/putrescine ABC transporter substrate-binding protein [Pelagibius litoralis]
MFSLTQGHVKSALPRHSGRLLGAAVVTAGVATGSVLFPLSAQAAEELNALVWCDHTDPALIKPFEEKYGVKVNLKEYEGTGAALAIVEQSRPGDWDVFVIDGVDVPRVVEAGLLAELPKGELPLADTFSQVQMTDVTHKDGKMYAIMEKFGYNVISYDKSKVDPADMRDLQTLWSDKYKSRIAVYDYYIPLMNLVALKMGMKPSDITADKLPAIRDELFKLKDNSAMVGEVVSSTTALATGEADILIGGGEWAVAVMQSENPDLDWVLPDQGGILWSQSLAVFKDSKNKDLAVEFVKYVMSPEGQARLATSSCFWGMPANKKAGALLSPEQKSALRWDEQEKFLANSHRYFIPDAELDAEMLDVWTEFLQH